MPSTATVPAQPQTGSAQRAVVLTKAVLAAAERLGLTQSALADILGVSKATVSRMARANHGIAPDSKPGELALLLVRLYRSLDSIVGHDDAAKRWLQSPHAVLNGTPRELIRNTEGLVHAVAYLDAQRARI